MDKKSSSGIGISSVVTIVFVILKLLKVINWSWIWVLSPIWLTILFWIIIFGIIFIIHAIIEARYR